MKITTNEAILLSKYVGRFLSFFLKGILEGT